MFERPKAGEKAVLLNVDISHESEKADFNEFFELAKSAGAEIVATLSTKRDLPDAKFFIGRGKVSELKQTLRASHSNLILINRSLSPAQERNLEKELACRVLDRTGLILDIFAQRAQTFEGKLQVELAQLTHLSTRLVRGWTHLERQKGGIGLRGPGETQLETDKRLLRNRIKSIHKRLHKVKQARVQSRRARQRALVPTVSLVGYTNAGKSSLFNRLTGADVLAANKPFATLDPTLRQLSVPGYSNVIVADTVGFIRALPHDLIAAFSATLEETRDASLLIQVVDMSDADRKVHRQQVNQVLKTIKAQDVPQLIVYNKIDLTDDAEPNVERDRQGRPQAVWISAAKNLGIDLLVNAIGERVFGDPIVRTLILDQKQGKLRAKLYAAKAVMNERLDSHGFWILNVKMTKSDFSQLLPQINLDSKADLKPIFIS
ncbi:MAG: ribosome rescue GTPase HflX [Pseudomonadota bacterium]